MHANNDSLGVRSASVSGSDAEGRPFEVCQSARPTFFIWPHHNPVLKFSEVSRGDGSSLWIKLPDVAGGVHDTPGSDRRSVTNRLTRDAGLSTKGMKAAGGTKPIAASFFE
jgi:hypothetical protein